MLHATCTSGPARAPARVRLIDPSTACLIYVRLERDTLELGHVSQRLALFSSELHKTLQ